MELMSNGTLSVTSRGKFALQLTIELAMHKTRGVGSWKKNGEAVLWLFELPSQMQESIALPFLMNVEGTVQFVSDWLAQVDDEDRLQAEDFDGSLESDGFHLRAGQAVTGNALLEVQAVWSHFHK